MTPRMVTPLDGVVVAGILALCWALWGVGGVPPEAGESGVEVITDRGSERHPFSAARQLRVAGPLGESVLQLGPDGVRFLSSPCPLQLCIHTGRLARPGAVAACLPNRVAVRVVGDGVQETVDAVGR